MLTNFLKFMSDISNNFHKSEENNSKDIPELLGNKENTHGDSDAVNIMTSMGRKSLLYGYLVKQKRYGGKLITPSLQKKSTLRYGFEKIISLSAWVKYHLEFLKSLELIG